LRPLKSIIVIILLAAAAGGEALLYIDLNNDHEALLTDYAVLSSAHLELEREFTDLQGRLTSLNASYSGLSAEYSLLNRSYHSLSSSYDSLNERYTWLKQEYQALEGNYTTLQAAYISLNESYCELIESYEQLYSTYSSSLDAYETLNASYAELKRTLEVERALRMGNSLATYYEYLRGELGSTGVSGGLPDPEYVQKQAEFGANLALHDLGLVYWPEIEDTYHEDVGEYSYDAASVKLVEVASLIKVDDSDPPTERIRKILDFIHWNLKYEPEVDDFFHAPVETLALKSGDCDDFTILASALFEYAGIDSAVGLFSNENGEYHAMVLVRLDDLEGYAYFYYESLTGIGLEEGRWIIIEPQSTIDRQSDKWIEQWNLLAAAPLDA